jgi:hypothetical protein
LFPDFAVRASDAPYSWRSVPFGGGYVDGFLCA